MTHRVLRQALVVLSVAAAPLSAQVVVGSEPDKSPLLDLNDGQRFGIIGGVLVTPTDPLRIGPKGGAALGVRYDLHLGGPVYVLVDLLGVPNSRNVIDPTKKAGARDAGTQSSMLLLSDVSLAMSATGERSWRGLQPLVHLGVGTATALGDKMDVGGYSMGTRFAFVGGVGLRFATGKRSELRCDASWYYWTLKYPDGYHTSHSADSTAILPATTKLNVGTWNQTITVSWTWSIFR